VYLVCVCGHVSVADVRFNNEEEEEEEEVKIKIIRINN
jgi:hypothetical protein